MFGWATIMLGIGPHSSCCSVYLPVNNEIPFVQKYPFVLLCTMTDVQLLLVVMFMTGMM